MAVVEPRSPRAVFCVMTVTGFDAFRFSVCRICSSSSFLREITLSSADLNAQECDFWVILRSIVMKSPYTSCRKASWSRVGLFQMVTFTTASS